jgi:hypothetical protein
MKTESTFTPGPQYVSKRTATDLMEAIRRLANIATHPKATLAHRTLIANEARSLLAKVEGRT